MKKFSIFITVLLIILILSLVFVLQNSTTIVSLKFFGWSFPTASIGLLTIIVFFAGFIVMWLISLMFYISSSASYRRKIKERDQTIKKLQQEKESLLKEVGEQKQKLSELEAKLNAMQKQQPVEKSLDEGKLQVNDIQKENDGNNANANVSEEKTEDKAADENANEKPKRRGLFRRR
jgi:uncharacterized integral membrane protein